MTHAFVFALGLFPVLFLPALQAAMALVLVGLIAGRRRLAPATRAHVLTWQTLALWQFALFYLINVLLFAPWEGTPDHHPEGPARQNIAAHTAYSGAGGRGCARTGAVSGLRGPGRCAQPEFSDRLRSPVHSQCTSLYAVRSRRAGCTSDIRLVMLNLRRGLAGIRPNRMK